MIKETKRLALALLKNYSESVLYEALHILHLITLLDFTQMEEIQDLTHLLSHHSVKIRRKTLLILQECDVSIDLDNILTQFHQFLEIDSDKNVTLMLKILKNCHQSQ